MEDPTTIALNLTFFGTLGVAFVMFLGLFIVLPSPWCSPASAGCGIVVVALAGRLRGRPARRQSWRSRCNGEDGKAAPPRQNPAKKEPHCPRSGPPP